MLRLLLISTQQDKHYTFEDPKSATSDGSATSASAEEWLEVIDRAREIALSQSVANSYSGGDSLKELSSSGPSSSRDLDLHSPGLVENGNARHMLHKNHAGADESFMGRKRFSKRQSKSGLAAVF